MIILFIRLGISLFIKIHTLANFQCHIFHINSRIPEFFHIQMNVNILHPYFTLWRISLQFDVCIVDFILFFLILLYNCFLGSNLLSTPLLPVFTNCGIPFNVQHLQDVKFLGTGYDGSPHLWIIVKPSSINLGSLKNSDP